MSFRRSSKQIECFENSEEYGKEVRISSPQFVSHRYQSNLAMDANSIRDFQRSIDAEKNLCRLSQIYENSSQSVQLQLNGVIQQSYRLQIKNLLDEVNDLKLQQIQLQRKYDKSQRDCQCRPRNSSITVQNIDLSIELNQNLEKSQGHNEQKIEQWDVRNYSSSNDKFSLMSEFQSQIQDYQTENTMFQLANDFQKQIIDQLTETVAQLTYTQDIQNEQQLQEMIMLQQTLQEQSQQSIGLQQKLDECNKEIKQLQIFANNQMIENLKTNVEQRENKENVPQKQNACIVVVPPRTFQDSLNMLKKLDLIIKENQISAHDKLLKQVKCQLINCLNWEIKREIENQ